MVRAYWWRGTSNWGDALTPLLLQHFSGVNPVWSLPDHADVIVTGSVLGHMPVPWRGTVLGAGLLQETDDFPLAANVLAVRGPLTAQHAGTDATVTGDPALLAPELIDSMPKAYELGLLPHWSDPDLTQRPEFLKYDPLIMNPLASPFIVMRQISACRKLVTSSLHGLIIADAMGVPRRFEFPPQENMHPVEHGTFKLRDYHASLEMPFEPGVTGRPVEGKVWDLQHAIYDVMRDYGKMVKT